jgi:hypothetical protein
MAWTFTIQKYTMSVARLANPHYHLLSASSLVEQNNPVELGIKEASIRRADTTSGTAVQEDDGFAVGVTALFVAVVFDLGWAQT